MEVIKTIKGTFIIVKVPPDAWDFKIEYEDKYSTLWVRQKTISDNNPFSTEPTYEEWYFNGTILETRRKDGVPQFEIIGTSNKLTEEQFDLFVDDNYGVAYKDYMSDDENAFAKSATESFKSMIKFLKLDESQNYVIVKKI